MDQDQTDPTIKTTQSQSLPTNPAEPTCPQPNPLPTSSPPHVAANQSLLLESNPDPIQTDPTAKTVQIQSIPTTQAEPTFPQFNPLRIPETVASHTLTQPAPYLAPFLEDYNLKEPIPMLPINQTRLLNIQIPSARSKHNWESFVADMMSDEENYWSDAANRKTRKQGKRGRPLKNK